ncbi:MAG: YtxH domain-containing protein [Chloroflexota bacterium]
MSERDDFGFFVVGFFVGALAGAVTALLVAPQSGEETRMLIRDKSTSTVEDARVKANALVAEARERADEIVAEARVKADELVGKADELVAKGQAAIKKNIPARGSEDAEASEA